MDMCSYHLVTAAYRSFTLTDGALRMLVLLYSAERLLEVEEVA